MARGKGIFIAATRQHVGKTTSSLAVISGLVKRFGQDRVAYIKPVGQQHETVEGLRIDKDARLMKEFFGLSCQYKDMSPVVMPKGYTRAFLDGAITEKQQLEHMQASYARIAADADIVVLEGSGHTGVGSIVHLNNARVAKTLNADIVLVGNGGLGSAYDELELNRAMCNEHGVKIRGVIINKVIHDKYDMVKEYFGKALKRWGVPLLGVIPDEPYLGRPTIRDLERLLKGTFIAGVQCRDRHYDLKDVDLVTTELNRFVQEMETMETMRPLFITHCSRSDVILGFAAQTAKLIQEGKPFQGALILSGANEQPSEYVQNVVKANNLPVMHAPLTTAAVMAKIQPFVSKLNIEDKARVRKAISHYEPYIDFEALLHGH